MIQTDFIFAHFRQTPHHFLLWLSKFGVVILTLLSNMLIHSYAAEAETRNKQCDAVRNMAEIQYDSKILLNIVKDTSSHICSFYASLPPTLQARSQIEKTAETFYDLYASKDTDMTVNAFGAGFQFNVIESLLAPLNDPRFAGETTKYLQAYVYEKSEDVEDCLYDVIINDASFHSVNDIISCGLHTSNNSFIIEASHKHLTASLIIPLN